MSLIKHTFKTQIELSQHIKTHMPSFYYSSQTSTVIPYDKLEQIFTDDHFHLVNLSQLPAHMELTDSNNLIVKGPVNWKDARSFLKQHNRNIMTAPTEELALISAGAATSATGERCFSLGNLRSQILRIKYLNYQGIEVELHAHKSIENFESLSSYSKDFNTYQELKNAPFPRFEQETDLMIGTEGQLGVITEVELKTCDNFQVQHLFMLLPKWEDGPAQHLEIAKKIQAFKKNVILCELVDSNSFSYLPAEDRPNQGMDAIFFEVRSCFFERFYEDFLQKLSFLNEEMVFEMSENKFHNLRASIPRAVFEENSRLGVTKMGTDVQVKLHDFEALMQIYNDFTKQGVDYNLFGHFGDCHLHFNFMPSPADVNQCQEQFESMYKKIAKLNASPFAEHGIGIIKQKYITSFWNENQTKLFSQIKKVHDPYNQFFPQGFMNLKV